jgi:hypothetical protein
MREICTSGSVGGEGGNILAYPALSPAKPIGNVAARTGSDGFRNAIKLAQIA